MEGGESPAFTGTHVHVSTCSSLASQVTRAYHVGVVFWAKMAKTNWKGGGSNSGEEKQCWNILGNKIPPQHQWPFLAPCGLCDDSVSLPQTSNTVSYTHEIISSIFFSYLSSTSLVNNHKSQFMEMTREFSKSNTIPLSFSKSPDWCSGKFRATF